MTGFKSESCRGTWLTPQGRRNDFWIGGGGAKPRKKFFNHTFFKRIQFCSLVYLWFQISAELLTYFSHISIHWRCFYNLEFFGLAKYWGGGGNCPPAPLFLRPCWPQIKHQRLEVVPLPQPQTWTHKWSSLQDTVWSSYKNSQTRSLVFLITSCPWSL